MVDAFTVTLVVFAGGAAFFAAWTIGAGSTGATPFAPAVGAGAISTMRAAFIVGLLGFAGAVLQGAAVTETIGRDLVVGDPLTPLAATIALLIAAVAIGAGVFRGYPIATAFAITGSVIGVGIAMGGGPAWTRWTEIGAYWLLTPVFVAPIAYVATRGLRTDSVSNHFFLPLLGAIVGGTIANMEFLFIGPADVPMSPAERIVNIVDGPDMAILLVTSLVFGLVLAGLVWVAIRRDPVEAQRWFLLWLGALVAFTAGGGKVGLAVGPLLPLLDDVVGTVSITWVLVFGGIGILAGTWLAATRMIKALSQDYSALGPNRSIGVLIPSFVIAQIGILYGIPMSFNEIFISAIAGAGYAVGSASVSHDKLFWTAVAWLASLIGSFAVGFVIYSAVTAATGIA